MVEGKDFQVVDGQLDYMSVNMGKFLDEAIDFFKNEMLYLEGENSSQERYVEKILDALYKLEKYGEWSKDELLVKMVVNLLHEEKLISSGLDGDGYYVLDEIGDYSKALMDELSNAA